MRGLVGLVPGVGEVRQALGAVRAEGKVDRVLARRLGARDRHESRVLLLASGDAVVEAAVGDRLALGGLSLGQAIAGALHLAGLGCGGLG